MELSEARAEDQLDFLWSLAFDWRQSSDGREKLAKIPDRDWRRFARISERAFPGRPISAGQQSWLNEFERKIQRLQRGLSYKPTIEPVKQQEMFV